MSDAMTGHAGDDGAMHDGPWAHCPAPGCGGEQAPVQRGWIMSDTMTAGRWYGGTWCSHRVKVFEAAGRNSAVSVEPWPCTEACRAALPALTRTPVPVVWHISTVTVTAGRQSVTGGTWTEWDDPSPVD